MAKRARRIFGGVCFVLNLFLVLGGGAPSFGQDYKSRIKDIANFEGVRDNILVGYGIIVGLNGSGDKLSSAVFTRHSLTGMLERLGINTKNGGLDTKNVAAVMVTATLPPFARPGGRIDVIVSALGDAKSLFGGALVVTPLHGADGEVYAVAQGPVIASGFAAGGAAQTFVKGVPTSGRIPNGAIIERSTDFRLRDQSRIMVSLRSPDFTTVKRVAEIINGSIGQLISMPIDSGTVEVTVPPGYPGGVVALLTEIEQLSIVPDQSARVMINEETGTVVISKDVRIDPVAISQGGLTVRVTETPQVSQPGALSTGGQTRTVDRTQVDVTETGTGKVALFARGASLQDLVNGLNSLGISPRDLIAVLQALKASGALRAELTAM
ncbi:MAG: flagellar basal body P-ring protein FlgI [Alphaproteobacteria bacterium]|nr:flagellar basal body P-ring protein FlgI [Alphaproteobacteria bacterium]